MKHSYLLALACATSLATPAFAQEQDHSGMDMDMPGMDMSGHDDKKSVSKNAMRMPTDDDCWNHVPDIPFVHIEKCRSIWPSSEGSGTARLPGNEDSMRGHHVMAGEWMLMLHGSVSAQYTKVTGPRGDDKLYATSMAMLTAERQTDWGRVRFISMFSLEPLMKNRG